VLTVATFVDHASSATTTKQFSIQGGSLVLEDGINPAVALTNGVTVTNLVFRTPPVRTAWYARKSGDNANDCRTAATACLTIQEAHDKATADGSGTGDIIYVGSGIYNETVTIAQSGVSGNTFYFLADTTGFYTGDPAGAVTVDGDTHGFEMPSSGSQIGIDYVVIDGFTITNSDSGVWAAHGSDNNLVRNCTIANNTNGIYLTRTWGNGSFAHSTGWIIEDNTISNNSDSGIYFASGEYTNTIIQRNAIHDNGRGIRATDGGNGGHEPANNVTVRHNQIYDNTNEGIKGHKWFDGTFFDNLIYGNGSHGFEVPHRSNSSAQVIYVRNNTINNNGGDGMIFGNSTNRSAMNTATVIENNIVTNNSDDGMDITLGNYCTIPRNNNVWGNGTNYEDCSDLTGSNGNISADPLYVGGYYLSQTVSGQGSDSPSVDAGFDTAENNNLNTRTTRTDVAVDSGTVDMGYHYPVGSASSSPTVLGVSASQFVRIEMTVQGGEGRFQKTQTLYGTAVLRGSY
jgi:parallel beta-helix repeat protein